MRKFAVGRDYLLIYDLSEPPGREAGDFRYVIKRIDPFSKTEAEALMTRGFRFHDRILRMEIDLNAAGVWQKEYPVGFSAEPDNTYTAEMYELACRAFSWDHRFHLTHSGSQDDAKQAIYAYIEDCKACGLPILKVQKQGDLLGYTILKKVSDTVCENVLGVTKPGITGKMAAFPLYSGMLNYLGDLAYKKYHAEVSGMNIASMNLHMQLGAKVKAVCDEYILENDTGAPP